MMNTTLIFSRLGLCAALAATGGMASAAEGRLPTLKPATTIKASAGMISPFTFNVPIRFTNVDPSMRMNVQCTVTERQLNFHSGGEAIAQGSAPISIPASGNFTGTVRVSTTLKPGKDPVMGRYYFCSYAFEGAGAREGTTPGGTYFKMHRDPGAPFVYSASGEIPR